MSKVEKKRGRISVLKSYAGHQHRAVNFAYSTALILRRKDVEEKRHLEEEF